MTASNSPRRQRSRSGFVIYMLVLLLLAWELVAAFWPGGPPAMTAGRFLKASWAVATGGAAGPAGDPEVIAKLAFRPLPYVMYGLKPDFVRERGAQDPPGFVRSSNALGFRGPDVAVPKPAGVYRIVCLGGSTTYSNRVSDESTYPVLLEAELRQRRPDLQVEVVNAGVVSYTTAESLTNLAFRCLELEPDCVVVYHAANDARTGFYPEFEPDYSHYRKPWSGDGAALGEDPAGRLGFDVFIQHPIPEDEAPRAAGDAGPAAFRRNLVSLCALARGHGALPVLVTFAAHQGKAEVEMPGLWEGIMENNGLTRAVCAQLDVPLVDLDAAMPRDDGLYADAIHLTAQGTPVKARLIADGLVEHLP